MWAKSGDTKGETNGITAGKNNYWKAIRSWRLSWTHGLLAARAARPKITHTAAPNDC